MQKTLLETKYITKGQMAGNLRSSQCLGQDGQQVLIKHERHSIHVHPCRLILERTLTMIQSKNENIQEKQ